MIVVFYIIQLKKESKSRNNCCSPKIMHTFLFLRLNFGRQTKGKIGCLIHNYQRTLQVMTAAPQMLQYCVPVNTNVTCILL